MSACKRLYAVSKEVLEVLRSHNTNSGNESNQVKNGYEQTKKMQIKRLCVCV